VIRDHTKRKVFEQYETQRQALRYIIRNTTLPPRARAQAQLQLSQMHAYTRSTQINNRCIEGGKSRGVLRHFRMARYPFRMNALEGNIPGVKKASCSPYRSRYCITMYRLHESALPADFQFPADLEKLGYAINDKDQIRSLNNPDQEFNFFISKNERMNMVQREAHNTCIRTNIQSRVLASSMNLTNLPLGTPSTKPHIPIYTSTNIATCNRLIVYIGESWQDLGIFAWRTIGHESIAAGSILHFIDAIQTISPESPGVLIANTGQLLWYRGGSRAVTQTTWMALPRQWAVSPPMEIDDEKNRVPGHGDAKEHVASIFDDVIPKMCKKGVAIDVIGMGDGGPIIAEYLQGNWKNWKGQVKAVAIGSGAIWLGDKIADGEFVKFWEDRTRAYIQSDEPVGTPLTGREDFGCNCYSAGQNEVLERVMPMAHSDMLKFFQLVNDVPGYRELPEMTAEDVDV
ncbi:MAG: hypothetical protein Q9192_006278, partial [Flavoplaca navasiana]